MDLADARRFAAEHHRAVLATTRPDGRPQLTPITVGVDGEGHLVFSSRQTAYKVRYLRARPETSLCVFTDAFFGSWIQVDGTAEVIDLPDAMEPLVDYYRTISGEHPDWDDYRAAMERERRVIVRITPTHAGPDRQG
jgi:PPOX class probable F420-dependent enzyme